MPRIAGVRERRHQPVYDTLVRATGPLANPIGARSSLFGAANVGRFDFTNLQVAGQLASDQTYVTLALRAHLYFAGTNALDNYRNVSEQLYFSYVLGDKPQFQGPCWYFPSGGGLYGSDGTSQVYSNGYPSSSAIAKLARPIIIPVRQNIQVQAEFYSLGTTDALALLNAGAADDQKFILFMIDGQDTPCMAHAA